MNSVQSIRAARKARLTLATATLLPLSACLNVVGDSNNFNNYGAITIRGSGGTLSPVTTVGDAVFFRALNASVPNSATVTNNCAYSAVDTTTPVSRGDLRAGSELTLVSGANANKVTRAMALNATTVAYKTASPFTYAAGDSVRITVPGDAAGYPESNIVVRLAEPIIPEDVVVPPENTAMQIRWNQGDGTSAIILTVRYANPATSNYPNEQIVCSLVDDGSEDLPANGIGPFLNSPADKRSIRLSRWRTAQNNPTAATLLHIVSLVDSAAKLK
jgi:hypothetical protein